MFKGFIIAVSGLSVICAAAGTVMPEGRTKKILSFCLSCAAVLIISVAVKQAVSGVKEGDFSFGGIFGELSGGVSETDGVFCAGKFGEYECDNEKLRAFVAESYISRAKTALEKQGICLENAGVSFGADDKKVIPEKFIVDSCDLVIIEKNEHINISLKCKEVLDELFKNEEVVVIVNERK